MWMCSINIGKIVRGVCVQGVFPAMGMDVNRLPEIAGEIHHSEIPS